MSKVRGVLNDDDRRLLVAYYSFYRSLDTGSRMPTTSAQHHFVAVCRRTAKPESEHEHAYMRFKQAIAEAGIDEATAVVAGFEVPAPSLAQRGAPSRADVAKARLCAECGQPIPRNRLAVFPNATRCVHCQEGTDLDSQNLHVSEVKCPRCAARGIQSQLVWRTASDPNIPGYFLGCSRFPDCRYVDRS
jgi:phage/conjugal plasmid C-4 type zinc finger TraR family protein